MLTTRRRLAASILVTAAGTAMVAWGLTVPAAQAATAGCEVTYAVSSQWAGGFTANITLKLGDPVTAWNLARPASPNSPSGCSATGGGI